MGKSTRNQKKRLAKKKSLIPDLSLYSIEELLKKCQEEINIFNYEKAQEFCKEALSRDADDLRALEISAELCLETNNIKGAKHCLGRAITLSPNNGYTKYFSMAQLMEGSEALKLYFKGIEILDQLIKSIPKENISKLDNSNIPLEKTESNTVISTINNTEKMEEYENPSSSEHKEIVLNNDSLLRVLSNAYCSVAELYMSDLCDCEEAEIESNKYIQKAIETDLTNPEAYQHYANFLLVKQDIEEARKIIKKSLSLWLPKYIEVDEGTAADGTFDPVEVSPLSHASRISCVQILIELEEHQLASDVLEGLLGENDEDVYTWYLEGWNMYLQNDKKYEAKQNLLKALELNNRSPIDDLQVIDHINDLLKELKDVSEPPENAVDEENDFDDEENDKMEVT